MPDDRITQAIRELLSLAKLCPPREDSRIADELLRYIEEPRSGVKSMAPLLLAMSQCIRYEHTMVWEDDEGSCVADCKRCALDAALAEAEHELGVRG